MIAQTETNVESHKSVDGCIQTDLTLTDVTNLFTYKDWYVNKAWDAFSNFAKFRKDILKKVKDEYITKKKHSNKRKQKSSGDASLATPKLRKTGESEAPGFGAEEIKYETSIINSLQNTGEIIVKTNRGPKAKRKEFESVSEKIQEFSGQAYLDSPKRISKLNKFKSEGMQASGVFDSTDKTTQSGWSATTATSTQTLSETTSDVGMQFPAFGETSSLSVGG